MGEAASEGAASDSYVMKMFGNNFHVEKSCCGIYRNKRRSV